MQLARRLATLVGLVVVGWFLGTLTGIVVGTLIDVATGEDFVSKIYRMVPLFAMLGAGVGAVAGIYVWRNGWPRPQFRTGRAIVLGFLLVDAIALVILIVALGLNQRD